jgi:hypothetical protein
MLAMGKTDLIKYLPEQKVYSGLIFSILPLFLSIITINKREIT